jgi:septum formation protein
MISQKEELTTDTNKMLILGSGSSARKELLYSVGLVPDRVETPDVDETPRVNENPRHYVKRIAIEKANSIVCEKQSYLITADTIVTVGKRLLMKTSDKERVEEYLNLLSGRRHSVYTAFCVKHSGLINFKLVRTVLKMRLLTEKEIIAYIACGEWIGCSGGYSIQGRAKCFFPFISGCYSNVVGLPLPSLIGVLSTLGYYKN